MDLVSIGIATDEGRSYYEDGRDMNPRAVVETFAAQSLTEGASFAAEGARIVCHHQITQVATVYAITAEFYTAAFAMQTAAENMIRDLTRIAAEGNLYDHGPTNDPDLAISMAKTGLAAAANLAQQLGGVLQATQNTIAGVGHQDGNGN